MIIELEIKQKSEFTEQKFIEFLLKQDIIVKTNTKARGNLGICFANRIDISKNASSERRIAILAHEYAHKVHFDLEKDSFRKGGSLEKLFKISDINEIFKINRELISVTNFVDENSRFIKFYSRKFEILREFKILEEIIQQEYPDFKKSEDFKPINIYFKKNKIQARHLLKYDNIKIIHPIFKKEEIFSIKNLDKDFPDIPCVLRTYLKLMSVKREYDKLCRLKRKAVKYYQRPTELFARFIEGIFTDQNKIQELAPNACSGFFELLNQNYYGKLRELFILAGIL